MAEKTTPLKPFPVPDRYLNAKRKAVESLWCDRLSVIENHKTTDPETHLTEHEWELVASDIPCRIVSQTHEPTENENQPARAYKTINVVLSNSVAVPPGSIVEITTLNGETRRYRHSGQPLMKSASQTITLEIIKDYA